MSEKCRVCGEERPAALEEHHQLPNRIGGGDSPENMVMLCANCHRVLESIYDKQFWDTAEAHFEAKYEEHVEALQEHIKDLAAELADRDEKEICSHCGVEWSEREKETGTHRCDVFSVKYDSSRA